MTDIVTRLPINEIRQKLNLDKGIFKNIPDDLILLAFLPEHPPPGLVSNQLLNNLQRKYGYNNYEFFEFFGDSVLDFIVVRMMTRYPQINNPDIGTRTKQNIVKNSNLDCMLRNRTVCAYALEKGPKACANIFEAIVGILYFWLDQQKMDTLNILEEWLDSSFNIKGQIIEQIKGNSPTCKKPRSRPKPEPEIPEIIVKNKELIFDLKYWKDQKQSVTKKWENLAKTGWPVASDLGYRLKIFPSKKEEDIANLVQSEIDKIKRSTPDNVNNIIKIFQRLLPGVDRELWESLRPTKQVLLNYLDWLETGDIERLAPILNLWKSSNKDIILPDEINSPLDVVNYFLDIATY